MIVKSEQMREESRSGMRGGNGDINFTHMLEKDNMLGKARLAARIRVPAGASAGRHSHGPDAEILIITSGSALVDDNGTTHTLTAGDVMFTGCGESHSFSNAGEEPLEIIGIVFE